jgi:hypothetical protein
LLFRLTKYSNSSEDATSDSDDNRFRPKIRVKKIKLGFFSQKCILTLLRRILFYWRNLFIRWLINEETLIKVNGKVIKKKFRQNLIESRPVTFTFASRICNESNWIVKVEVQVEIENKMFEFC